MGANGFGLGLGMVEVEQRDGGPLERVRCAAVEEGANARDGIDDVGGANGPADAPARVAPVLGKPVEDDDGSRFTSSTNSAALTEPEVEAAESQM